MRTDSLLLALLFLGCTGSIESPGNTRDREEIVDLPSVPADPPADDPWLPPAVTSECEGVTCAGSSGLMRINRAQYFHSVRALLGNTVEINTDNLPADHEAVFYASNDHDVTQMDVDAYASSAALIAAQVLAAPSFVTCEPSRACALDTMRALVSRAYRRPLREEEDQAYTEFVGEIFDEDGFPQVMASLVETMLQSPNFLYRVEHVETETAPERLDGLAIATRLSLFLHREPPSAALRERALAGELDTREGVQAVARELLGDWRSQRAIFEFHREWLGIGGLEDGAAGDLSPEIARDLRREAELFAREVIRAGGTLEELLTARWSMLTPRLAEHYGVEATFAGDDFERVEMPERSGLLTAGGAMTAHGNDSFTRPIFRGLFIRSRLLCQELPPAPSGALEAAERTNQGLTGELSDRERLEAITFANPTCESCHRVMNSVGYGLEAFDELGRFRMHDATGAVVDIGGVIDRVTVPGDITYRTDVDGEYVGAHELGARLAESETVGRCVTRQWLRFALQRKESARDQASIDEAFASFAASGGVLEELIVAIVGTDAFLTRQAAGTTAE